MNRSEQINELATALSKAQAEFVMPEKNRTVTVATKTGGKYTFHYADLGAIIEATKAPLAKHGLCVSHSTEVAEQAFWLVTTLLHSSGQWQSARYPLPKGGEAKDMGSAITYGRRYLMSALLNVVADDDNDAEPNHLAEVTSRNAPSSATGPRQTPNENQLIPNRAVSPPIQNVTQVTKPAARPAAPRRHPNEPQ